MAPLGSGNTVDEPSVEEREIAIGAGGLSDAATVRGFAEYLWAREWIFRADGKRVRTVEAEDSFEPGSTSTSPLAGAAPFSFATCHKVVTSLSQEFCRLADTG